VGSLQIGGTIEIRWVQLRPEPPITSRHNQRESRQLTRLLMHEELKAIAQQRLQQRWL
jgi:hypothetical protein